VVAAVRVGLAMQGWTRFARQDWIRTIASGGIGMAKVADSPHPPWVPAFAGMTTEKILDSGFRRNDDKKALGSGLRANDDRETLGFGLRGSDGDWPLAPHDAGWMVGMSAEWDDDLEGVHQRHVTARAHRGDERGCEAGTGEEREAPLGLRMRCAERSRGFLQRGKHVGPDRL
jgi:hypothetical protein